MVKYDLSNAFIDSLELPKYNQKSKSFGSKYEKGLNLVVAWRYGITKAASDIVAADRVKFFRFIWRLRYQKADGGRSSIDLGFWPAYGSRCCY
ncbi:MAG: hypothetical protein OXE99_10795 [Cellvibrionales bacterium]|nr:hypothetical protein [Cellvibrionales bacterium]